MNLYPVRRKGYYIYPISDRNGTLYRAARCYNCGYRKTSSFHILEDAIMWLDSLIGE